ncbi:lipopolysaccharide heptosyltransferase II [Amphritea sp. HPY]|uniref:lipopolysaccharide heptosyltransferase II n=1 Tax=Amphritea sp. HPY TaxID=3421652 RepID=UPI003D7E40D9
MDQAALVVGPSWVGDMLMSQALYRRMKQQNPERRIDVLAPDWCRAVLSRMPEIDNAIAMPVGHGSLQLGVRRELAKELKKNGYHQAFVLPNSLKSALVPWLAGIPRRIGWRGEMRYGLLNDLRVLDKQAFPLMVQRYAALAEAPLESAEQLPPILKPKLRIDNDGQQQALAQFNLVTDNAVAFCPGAEFGPAKRWPDYHYAALAAKLIAEGKQVWIFGSKKDHPVGEQIRQQLSPSEQAQCINLAGETSLEQAIDLLALADVAVSNDSGLMHMAAAVDTPLVALYGPTSPQHTPPLSDKAEVIRLIDGFIKIRKGDADQGYHQSMIDISPELAFQSLQKWLKG